MEEKTTDNFKNLKWVLLCSITLASLYILFDISRKTKFNTYKETFKGEAIGLTTNFKKVGRQRLLIYCFYVDGKVISQRNTMGGDEILNKFYKVKYDLNNPKGNYIFLDKELKPDSLTLVKNGFTWTKYYVYDGKVTSRYLEKSKWQ